MRPAAGNATPYVAAAAGLALFLVWTLRYVHLPALEYDEAIFVNAALGGDYPDKSFVYRDLFGVPVLLMPYIGALKAWVYAPIFAAFGVSPETIRVPVVLLSAGTISLAFFLARTVFGTWPALFVVVLLATDAAFAVMAKADWGPTAISAFLRVLALLAYFAFVRSRSPAALWLLAVTLALGVFNKLDFALFVLALAVAAGVVHRWAIVHAIRERPAATLVPLGLLTAWLGFAAVELVPPAARLDVSGAGEPWSEHLSNLPELVAVAFSGEGPYEWMTGSGLPRAGWLSAALAVSFAAVVAVHLARLRRRDHASGGDPEAKAGRFLLVALAVIAAGLALTRQVGGAHHVMLLWPLPYLLAAPLVRKAGAARAVAIAFAAAALAAHAYVAFAYERAYADGGPWSTTWTPEIYAVAAVVDRADPDGIATVDWGVGQVFALVDERERRRFVELWGAFASLPPGKAHARAFARRHLGHGRLLLVGRRDRRSAPGAGERLEEVLAALPPDAVRPLFRGRALVAYLVET